MNEAEKYAGKTTELSTRLNDIQKKIRLLEKFIETNTAKESNPEDAMISYREILDDPCSRDSLRVGDIFCAMFEHYVQTDQNDKAWEIVEEMKAGSYQINRYLDKEMLDTLCSKLGKSLKDNNNDGMMSPWGNDNDYMQSDAEEMDEEIEDLIG